MKNQLEFKSLYSFPFFPRMVQIKDKELNRAEQNRAKHDRPTFSVFFFPIHCVPLPSLSVGPRPTHLHFIHIHARIESRERSGNFRMVRWRRNICVKVKMQVNSETHGLFEFIALSYVLLLWTTTSTSNLFVMRRKMFVGNMLVWIGSMRMCQQVYSHKIESKNKGTIPKKVHSTTL